MRALAAIASLINRANDIFGKGVAWLTLLMVLTALVVVVLRYVFSIGYVWMQESYVWMHGLVFMLGAAYTLRHDGHVRVDLFYQKARPRFRSWVNLLGTVFLLFPLLGLVGWTCISYVADSWDKLESSNQAGGLPGLFILKTAIPVFCLLMALQGISIILRCVLELAGRDDLLRDYNLLPAAGDHVDV